jgi:hypothetical protein
MISTTHNVDMSRKPRTDCLLAFVVMRGIETPQWISKTTLSQKSEEINNLLWLLQAGSEQRPQRFVAACASRRP